MESKNGAPVGTRTPNQLIKSQLLYQLSYRGKTIEIQADAKSGKHKLTTTSKDGKWKTVHKDFVHFAINIGVTPVYRTPNACNLARACPLSGCNCSAR